MKLNRFFRKSKVKSPGFYCPMDIAPGEYAVDYPSIKRIIEAAMEKDWGPRCKTKDYDDFPDILDKPENNSRCPVCVAYERFDSFWEYFSPDEIS